jgi:hypothetical protein
MAYAREAGLNQRLALETSKAQKNEQSAVAAVKRFGDVVRENPVLKDDPRLLDLRRTFAEGAASLLPFTP